MRLFSFRRSLRNLFPIRILDRARFIFDRKRIRNSGLADLFILLFVTRGDKRLSVYGRRSRIISFCIRNRSLSKIQKEPILSFCRSRRDGIVPQLLVPS